MEKKDLLKAINEFYESINSEDMMNIIISDLKARGVNSLKCYAKGGFYDDEFVRETEFLRVGLKNECGLKHHGDEKEEVLCAIGVAVNSRVAVEFDRLPINVQVDIFKTCFDSKFTYPTRGCIPNRRFSRNNANFNKLKPTFKKCYFADYDNSLYEITFSGNWDETGRPIFIYIDGNGKEREVHFPEKGIYRISHGDVEHWGFDYAFSLDKEQLRKVCRGGFTHDYTIENKKIS